MSGSCVLEVVERAVFDCGDFMVAVLDTVNLCYSDQVE